MRDIFVGSFSIGLLGIWLDVVLRRRIEKRADLSRKCSENAAWRHHAWFLCDSFLGDQLLLLGLCAPPSPREGALSAGRDGVIINSLSCFSGSLFRSCSSVKHATEHGTAGYAQGPKRWARRT